MANLIVQLKHVDSKWLVDYHGHHLFHHRYHYRFHSRIRSWKSHRHLLRHRDRRRRQRRRKTRKRWNSRRCVRRNIAHWVGSGGTNSFRSSILKLPISFPRISPNLFASIYPRFYGNHYCALQLNPLCQGTCAVFDTNAEVIQQSLLAWTFVGRRSNSYWNHVWPFAYCMRIKWGMKVCHTSP